MSWELLGTLKIQKYQPYFLIWLYYGSELLLCKSFVVFEFYTISVVFEFYTFELCAQLGLPCISIGRKLLWRQMHTTYWWIDSIFFRHMNRINISNQKYVPEQGISSFFCQIWWFFQISRGTLSWSTLKIHQMSKMKKSLY